MNQDPKIVAFNAWRRRRALEAGLQSPDALIDEWKFKRILISSPKDIYDLENLRLLTGPLFTQYGQDLLALAQGRPTTDELPASTLRRIQAEEDATPAPTKASSKKKPAVVKGSGTRPSRAAPERPAVRRDDPPVKLHSSQGEQNRKAITDFVPGPTHEHLRGGAFEFQCQTLSFKFWETEFLEGWGSLLDGLADGSLAAESDDERTALAIFKREHKPVKEWEMAWTKLVLRRAYENT